ncbi:MAG TPA: AmmeMemoRadiSam system protein B [Desulfurivibrio alkaliphilus]|uniref:MEMO1 family protein ENN98_06370 n=1 Tax=Desulfurivibrio alkaliphilus TaxID=427923 RepID=A0A7C2TLB9_9BACT|nr:AmmeMemoRadiSam system protein B [Desulfurivibrio alkaliphilus]
MIRKAAVAHQFYPGEPATLHRMLKELIPDHPQPRKALALVMPHAGYVYSGRVAGETAARADIPENVIILGPNHHGLGAPAALMDQGSWEMPWGMVPVDEKLAAAVLVHCPDFSPDPSAHRQEHSLEVLVPFLHHRQAALRIVPICLARSDFAFCLRAGRGLAAAIRSHRQPVLLAASSDMSHYESRASASAKDRLAIDRVLALDPEGLYQTVAAHQISMCGVIPTVITLIAARELGASRAELVRYSDSGAVSGDLDQVVGYAGFIVS